MPPRKNLPPYRLGYKCELRYPKTGRLVAPDHGSGPRCRVDYDPGDDGPWTMVRIMRVERKDGKGEEYTCAMPRCYAIPLILINKRLAFYEAQCSPDGVPHQLADGSPSVKQREIKEYTYLWKLRCSFLQAVFDMNHERCLDEGWRSDRIHGYIHRVYKRYGHDAYQRVAYWRDEVKEGRVPYTTPDIADMDWEKYIVEDMASNMRLNAFVWNRISQGYSRVLTDDPPQEQWQAWRRGHRELKPSPYRTPPPPPPPSSRVPELSKVPRSESEIVDEARGCPRDVDDSEALAVAAASSSRLGDAAAPVMRCATISDGADDTCYEDALSSTVAGPLHLREWSFPFLMPEQSGEAVKVASTSGTGCLRSRLVSFRVDAPEHMQLTVVRCTFSRVEDVGDDFKTKLEVAYASRRSSTQALESGSAGSAAC